MNARLLTLTFLLLISLGVTGLVLADDTQARFDRDIRQKSCEILTADLVASTLSLQVDDLKQSKVMGCLYTWGDDSTRVDARLSWIRAHKSTDKAKTWFENNTKDRTKEELEAEVAQVKKRFEPTGKDDDETKQKMLEKILSAYSTEPITFESIKNLGDEARVHKNGEIYVRLSNITFSVSAYKGPSQPPMNTDGLTVSELTQLAKKYSADWAVQTAPQRKKDSIALTGAILEVLSKISD